jgi:hypothetical protein
VTITDRMAAWRRQRQVLQRVSRAARRLEQAERERAWALAPARAEGVSVRTLAAGSRLSPARVHQITAGAPCGRDRGDRVGAGMVVLQPGVLSDGTPVIIRGDIDGAVRAWRTGDATPVIPPLHRRESVQAVVIHSDVTSPGPGPTSSSTSQRSGGLRAGCRLFLGTNDRPVKRLIMAGYPVQRGLPPAITREAARRRLRNWGTLSGTSAEEEQMTGKIMPLRERDTTTVQAPADAFLSSPRYANPNTRRGYTGVLDRLLAGLGASRPLAEVSGGELAGLLEQLWGRCAPATWNRNRGAVTA